MIDRERLRSRLRFGACLLLGEIDSPTTSISLSDSSDKPADSSLHEKRCKIRIGKADATTGLNVPSAHCLQNYYVILKPLTGRCPFPSAKLASLLSSCSFSV